MVVWLLTYLSMDGDTNKMALQSIREELKGVLQVTKPEPSGLPFEDPPRLRFSTDLVNNGREKLRADCLVFTGALLEVERLETESEEYLSVTEDFILRSIPTTHSGESFQLKKGDTIYAAYGATNRDSQHWDRPKRFTPNRFIAKGEGGVFKSLQNKLPKKRFGAFQTMSQQADVLCITAALLAFYDFSSLSDGDLRHPGSNIVAGIGVPRDFKAKVTRRPIA